MAFCISSSTAAFAGAASFKESFQAESSSDFGSSRMFRSFSNFRDAKSGAFLGPKVPVSQTLVYVEGSTYVTSVAMLLTHDIRFATIAQPREEPWTFDGCRTMGPTPWALTIHQMKNVMPAMGTTTAFRVKRCRTL